MNSENLNQAIKDAISRMNHRGKETRSHRDIMKRYNDARITNPDINLQVRRANIQGEKIPQEEVPIYKLPKKTRDKIALSRISDDDYIIMEQYARFQPRGRRELLRLDIPEMKKLLMGNILDHLSLIHI